jgi:hypothetical protein
MKNTFFRIAAFSLPPVRLQPPGRLRGEIAEFAGSD